jgi:hypothetical protein
MAATSMQDLRSEAGDSAPNPVYEKKLGSPGFTKMPHCIYFFYMGPADAKTGHNPIYHYYDRGDDRPIDTDERLQTKIRALIRNARLKLGNQSPGPIGDNWKYVWMERVSHVVFAFDFDMRERPTLTAYQDRNPTHSFFDAQPMRIEDCEVITCINHLKAADGRPLDGTEKFVFDLITDPPLDWPNKDRLPDSGGTNTGPGVPP